MSSTLTSMIWYSRHTESIRLIYEKFKDRAFKYRDIAYLVPGFKSGAMGGLRRSGVICLENGKNRALSKNNSWVFTSKAKEYLRER